MVLHDTGDPETLSPKPSIVSLLQVGMNQLRSLDGIEALRSLDVLDAHSNRLEEVGSLRDLAHLRIANLGGEREQGRGAFEDAGSLRQDNRGNVARRDCRQMERHVLSPSLSLLQATVSGSCLTSRH